MLFHKVPRFIDNVEVNMQYNLIWVTVFVIGFFVISYSLGHIFALISAYTLERIVILFLNYPSVFLEMNYKIRNKYMDKQITKNIARIHEIDVWIVYWLCWPHSLTLEFLNFTPFVRHVLKTIDESVWTLVDKKYAYVFGSQRRDINPRSWFELMEHFVLTHNTGASSRMYNYLTIYGFFRNMSLVLYLCGLVGFYHVFFHDISYLHEHIIALSLSLIFASVLFLLFGFTKFWRRYSQEVIVSFIFTEMESDGTQKNNKRD